MTESQIVYGIEENKDGEVKELVLSPMDTSFKERVAYDGACKNIGDGIDYAVFDNKGIKHKLQVNEKGEIVTDDKKKLKDVFTKEVDEKELQKKAAADETKTKISDNHNKKGK